MIGTGVSISFNASIDENTKIMTGTNIGGNMIIGSHCFIGAHVYSVNDNYPKLNTKRENQVSAIIEDYVNKRTISLNRPTIGLHIPPKIWSAESNFSSELFA